MNHHIWIKGYLLCLISTFGIPFTIFDVLKVSNTPSLYGNLFRKSTPTYSSDPSIRLLYILNCTAWYVTILRSLIVHIESSIISTCSFLAYMCSKAFSNDIFNNDIILVVSVVVCYIENSCIIFCFISSSALMNDVAPIEISDFIKRKLIFIVLVCNNIKPFMLKRSI